MSDVSGVSTNKYDVYDLERLRTGVEPYGYAVEYADETKSTMDMAKLFGLQKTIVLAGYQTAGRGRHEREWEAEAGRSVLMTVIEPFNEAARDPAIDSIIPSQVFVTDACVGLQTVLGSSKVGIKWLNDLVARTQNEHNGRKLGGLLVENTSYKGPDRPYPKLFGIGINVNYENANKSFPNTDYGATSLKEIAPDAEFDLTDVVLAVIRQWQTGRNDLRVIESNANVFRYHDKRWQGNASLIGQMIEVSGFGAKRDHSVIGEAVATPLGGGLVLVDRDGNERLIKDQEYHSSTVIKVLEIA